MQALFTKQDSAFVISWNSLLGAAANKSFGRRSLFTLIRMDRTLDALWEVFGWSMIVLLSGILPERDWSGNEVPGGGRFVAGWRFPSQLTMRAVCAVERTQSVFSSGQLLATVLVGVPPGGRTQLTWPSSSCSGGQCLRCSAWSLVCCCRASRPTCCIAWTWGITAHVVANVNDSTSALYRQKGEKSKLQGKLTLARLRSSSGNTKLKAKGAATRHMASFTLELAGWHCAAPSDRCVLGVVQTLADI